MNLIDRRWTVSRLLVAPRRHPVLVGPIKLRLWCNDRGLARRQLGLPRHGISLGSNASVGSDYFELVAFPRPQAGDKELPHARVIAPAHRMASAIPAVEVAGD